MTELWSRENRHPQNPSQFFTISDIFFDFKSLHMQDKGSYEHPLFRVNYTTYGALSLDFEQYMSTCSLLLSI